MKLFNKKQEMDNSEFSQLDLLLQRKEKILNANSPKNLNTEPMPIHVMTWFNVVTCEIINIWNEGRYTITGVELLKRVKSKMSFEINPNEWEKALTTYCLPDIKGALNLLHFDSFEYTDNYIINFPKIDKFINSDIGKQLPSAMEMIYGFSFGKLRIPTEKKEIEWIKWLIQNFK